MTSALADGVPEGNAGSSRRSGFLTMVDGVWLEWLLLATAVLTFFAVPLNTIRLLTGWDAPLQVSVALAFAVLCCLIVWCLARYGVASMGAGVRVVERIPFWTILALGLGLRVAWIAIFPAQAGSDGAVYLGLAARLAEGQSYYTSGTHAYWPVGYPLYLAGWFYLFGSGKLVLLASSLVLYAVAFFGIARLTQTLAGSGAAHLAVLLFALWPNMIASVGVPEKEMLIVAILPWVTALILLAVRCENYLRALAVAGILMGVCIMVQPSMQFLPLALIVLLIGLSRDKWRACLGAFVFLLCIAAVLSPWVARNYSTFGTFVLVSTNGGSNLYRANNPLATGGYTKVGEVDLSGLDELEQDRKGRALALEWIRENPGDFGRLAVEKQIRFTGDDSAGVYVTFKVGKASDNLTAYALLKGIANLYWLQLWVILAALCLFRLQAGTAVPTLMRLPVWLWLYLFALHSVFESAGKYHMPVAWVLGVLIAGYAASLHQAQRE